MNAYNHFAVFGDILHNAKISLAPFYLTSPASRLRPKAPSAFNCFANRTMRPTLGGNRRLRDSPQLVNHIQAKPKQLHCSQTALSAACANLLRMCNTARIGQQGNEKKPRRKLNCNKALTSAPCRTRTGRKNTGENAHLPDVRRRKRRTPVRTRASRPCDRPNHPSLATA